MRGRKLPFSIDRSDWRSLVEQLKDGLREAIVSGYYRPGDTLPSYRELAPLLDVSEIVTKAALKQLAAEGLVTARPRIGTVVRDLGEKRWKGRVLLVTRGVGCGYYENVFAAVLRGLLANDGWLCAQVSVKWPYRAGCADLSELKVMIAHPASLAIGLAALASSASVTISDVIVRQQWPWNGKVNIDYILSDPDGGEHDINVIMRNGPDVVTNEFGSLSGDLFAVKSGSHRIVWDPAFRSPEYADAVLADFSVTLSTPEDSGQYMILDLSGGAEASIPVTFTNCPPAGGWNQDEYKTTKLVLRHIPAGTFRMGSPDDELGRSATREVMHNVTFTNDFYIGIFETTASQYSNMVHTAAEYSAGVSGSKLPAVRVLYSSLRGANDHNLAVYPAYEEGSFFDTFNKRFSFAGRFADYRFDLPTISQWEYACRAGTTGAWNDGTTITNVTTDAQLARIARYQANGYYNVGPVGAKNVPNAFGLYDMHGNARRA